MKPGACACKGSGQACKLKSLKPGLGADDEGRLVEENLFCFTDNVEQEIMTTRNVIDETNRLTT